MSAYLNALHEEGTREELLREVVRLYEENNQLRARLKMFQDDLEKRLHPPLMESK